MASKDLIKVGMIRCDTHAMWYGPLMAAHHPKLLQNPTDPNEEHKYSWQSGGVHMFFYARYGYPLQMSVPFSGGFRIAKIWDEDRKVAEMAARIFCEPPTVCDYFEQASDGVDLVFIADCNSDGAESLALAEPGLRKGVPTFIDKPFADTVENVRTILQLAKAHAAPIFSASILRFDQSVARFRNRLPEVGTVNFATIVGYGTHPAGVVHTLSTVQHLFGNGLSKVQVMQAENHTAYHVSYGLLAGKENRPLHGIMVNCDAGARPDTALAASVYGSETDIHMLTLGDYAFPYGTNIIIEHIRKMVQTKKTPSEMNEMLEVTMAIDAFNRSVKSRDAEQIGPILSL